MLVMGQRENGKYYSIMGLGLRLTYWVYIGIMDKKVETTKMQLYWV